MNQETLREIVSELSEVLPGRFFGRMFQLSPLSVAIDFGVREQGYLFVSVEPADPRLYLIKRRTRELEKAATSLSPFAQAMRATFGGGSVTAIVLDKEDRIVRLSFSIENELGDLLEPTLVAQLTGRSANLFILDKDGTIRHAWRNPKGDGQQPGEMYRPPPVQQKQMTANERFARIASSSMSEAVDDHYRQEASTEQFDQLAATVRDDLRKEISRRKKLQTNLKKDLAAHGDAEEHKRRGDLLLANIGTAKRRGSKVTLTDYFSEDTPLIDLEIDEHTSLQDAAADYFSRYTKAKRGVEEINSRLAQLETDLTNLEERHAAIETHIANRDLDALRLLAKPAAESPGSSKKQKASPALTGMRRYLSSDGYEVIVGRSARDNDRLTFRVARPNDLWLHAGDYPGSHVIVRNSSRDEIPHRTVIEAAQLAAKFSQAGNDSKVNIHYTRRKFLSKPKGAAAGLVRMSNFKTISVAPGENLQRL